MKKVLQKVWRVIRLIQGIICGAFTMAFVFLGISDRQQWVVYLVLALVFGLLTLLLLRRKKPKTAQISGAPVPGVSVQTEATPPDVPEDILRDMRKYYSPMQAQNDARILQESFQLCQQTYNFETFFSRLQLAQRCAHTLLQAKRAGCKISKQMVKACESALSAVPALKLDFLDRIYIKETTAAMQLKTPAGQRRRLEALLSELQEHDVDFMSVEDTYNEYLHRVRELMGE